MNNRGVVPGIEVKNSHLLFLDAPPQWQTDSGKIFLGERGGWGRGGGLYANDCARPHWRFGMFQVCGAYGRMLFTHHFQTLAIVRCAGVQHVRGPF
jgi:hypothetical protein